MKLQFETLSLEQFQNVDLPEPTGFRILVAIPTLKSTVGSGLIHIPDSAKEVQQSTAVTAFVVKLGPLAYADEGKFPTGAWVKPGDNVLIKAYTGNRFKVGDMEFRLINDDTPEAVVSSAALVQRI